MMMKTMKIKIMTRTKLMMTMKAKMIVPVTKVVHRRTFKNLIMGLMLLLFRMEVRRRRKLMKISNPKMKRIVLKRNLPIMKVL
jgi:hypothetical protein